MLIIILVLIVFIWFIAKVSQSQKRKLGQSLIKDSYKYNVSVSVGPNFPNFQSVSQDGDDYWVSSTETAKWAEVGIGNLIYFGKGLAAVSGNGPEPSLVDPSLPANLTIQDCAIRRLSYWPYYQEASSEARGAYLRWLSTGRKDPCADLGYVFLYFYGLERRALYDIKTSQRAKEEIATIKAEIERLLNIYTKSGSFQSYAGSLLDLLKVQDVGDSIYKIKPPPLRMNRFLTLEHKIALGQCAQDKAPLPADWAFIWLLSDPSTHLHTPASRCPDEFRKLFCQKYHDMFGDGIILGQSETRIKIAHRTASPSFHYGYKEYKANINLPDMGSSPVPRKTLQEIAEDCALQLSSYSRLIGKDKNLAGNFEAIIELPLALWPEEYRLKINQFYDHIANDNKPTIMQFKEFISSFQKLQDLTKQKILSLYRAIAEVGLGIEPDIRFGGDVPEQDSYIVLFIDDEKTKQCMASVQYLAIALILQLGAGVASSDGEISDIEKGFLLKQMETWLNLNESERRRLQAKLQLWQIEPPKMIRLKKKIEVLDNHSRESIGNFLAVIALTDERVPNEEIKILEKLFIILGLDPNTIYAKLHIGAAGPVTVHSPARAAGGYLIPGRTIKEQKGPFKLDANRLKALQEDSDRVAKILGAIFGQAQNEEEASAAASICIQDEERKESIFERLDKEYSALISILLSRPKWSRAELEELACARNLMVDGILERINDAFYLQYNKPFFEGFDPIEISKEIISEAPK